MKKQSELERRGGGPSSPGPRENEDPQAGLLPAIPEQLINAGSQTLLQYRSFNPAVDPCTDPGNVICYQNNPNFPEGMFVCVGGFYQPLNLIVPALAAADISCRLQMGNNQAIGNGVQTSVQWPTENYDTDNMHDPAVNPDRITIRTPGKYLLMAALLWDGSVTVGARQTQIFMNGAVRIANVILTGSDNTGIGAACSAIVQAIAGDFFNVVAYQTSGGNLVIVGTGGGGGQLGGQPYFAADKIG